MFSQIFEGNSQYQILVPDNDAKTWWARKCAGVVV